LSSLKTAILVNKIFLRWVCGEREFNQFPDNPEELQFIVLPVLDNSVEEIQVLEFWLV